MNCRELQPSDMDAIFDVRIRTWHNPDGAKELQQLGITPASFRALMKASQRGWDEKNTK